MEWKINIRITCFLFALLVFSLLIKRFQDKAIKYLILAGGCIAVIESHMAERISLLKSPGIPWNLDVALLALVYLAIGYYYKDKIKLILYDENKKIDLMAISVTVILAIFCIINYRTEEPFYYFDMKPVYYKEFFSAIIIPCAFGIAIARLIHWIVKYRFLSWLMYGLAYIGQMTLPIMFMHVPLNTWKDTLGYGRLMYVLIGIGVPVVFTLIFNRFKLMRKLFGLPELWKYNT